MVVRLIYLGDDGVLHLLREKFPKDQKKMVRCEACDKQATKCCAKEDQPMLWFCAKHYREHVRAAHKPPVDDYSGNQELNHNDV